MGDVQELQDAWLDSFKLVSEKYAKNTNAAIVVKAEVVEVLDGGTRQYSVACNGNIYNDAYAMSGVSYLPTTVVWLLVPMADFDQKKTILNAVDPSSEQYVNEDVVDREIPISNNLFNDGKEIELKSWVEEERPLTDIFSNNFAAMFANYLNLYRRFLFSVDIKTSIDASHQSKGDYGLILTLWFKNTETGSVEPKEFILNNETIEGNIYSFLTFQPVDKYYDIDSIWEYVGNDELYPPTLKAFVKGFDYSSSEIADKEDAPADIIIKNFEFKMINRMTEENLSGYYLTLVPNNGHYFGRGNDTVKVITPVLKVLGKDTSIEDWDCYWFIEDGSVNAVSSEYNRFGGAGWRCINRKTNITQDDNGRETYQYVTTDRTLTVKEEDVSYILRYKCVLVKDGVITNSAIIILENLDADTELSLESLTGSTTFVEGIGKVRLHGTVKYYNPNQTDEFITYWQRFDKDGNYLDSDFYEVDNYNYEPQDNYVIYTIDISFDCSKIIKSNLITCTFYKESSKSLGEDIDRVQTNLGTRSLNVAVSPNITYTVNILGGDVLYKYDADGDSPMIADYDGPVSSIVKEIKPITYAIYKPDGTEFTEEEYMQAVVTWRFPTQSMMKIDPSGWRQDDPDYFYKEITGHKEPYSLNYTIKDVYNKKMVNNTILLDVKFKDDEIHESVTPQFLKDGESGTNGSKYAALINYNGKAYGEYVNVDGKAWYSKVQLVYIAEPSEHSDDYWDKGWYITYIDNDGDEQLVPFNNANRKFTIQVYKDGAPLTDADLNDAEVTWTMFDSLYTKTCITCTHDTTNIKQGIISLKDGIEWTEPDDIYCPIIQCGVTIRNDIVRDSEGKITSSHDETVYTYYPIEVTRLKQLKKSDLVIPKIQDGFDDVLYASDGTNPKFDNTNTFKCVDDIYQENITEYVWSTSNNLEIEGSNIGNEAKVKPITKFLNGDTNNYVKVILGNADGVTQEIFNQRDEALEVRTTDEIWRDLYYIDREMSSSDIVHKLKNFKEYLWYDSDSSLTLFDIYLEKLEKARDIVSQRYDIIKIIQELKSAANAIYEYSKRNCEGTTYNYTSNNLNAIKKLSTIYEHFYLLAYPYSFDNLKNDKISSIKFTPKTDEANSIKEKKGQSVLDGLKSLINDWDIVALRYKTAWDKILETNSDEEYIYQESFDFLYEMINGKSNPEKSKHELETNEALKNLPRNCPIRLANISDITKNYRKTDGSTGIVTVPKEEIENALRELITFEDKITSTVNRLKNGSKPVEWPNQEPTEEEIKENNLYKDDDGKYYTWDNGRIYSYNDYITLLIQILDDYSKIYYLNDDKQTYYEELSNEWEEKVKEADTKVKHYDFLLSATMVDKIVHIKPIIMTLNRYSMANINAWDGTKLYTGGDNEEYLLAPQIGAGIKNSDNSFTGMIMGIRSFNKGETKTEDIGLFGYSSGAQSMFLNAKDGSATFGLSGEGQIQIIPGTNAVIQSGDYGSGHGLMIKFNKNPEIKFGSGNFIVTSDGHLTAKGGGSIAGWKISNTQLKSDGDKTILDSNGKITCDTLEAKTNGNIGGWTINGSTLKSGNNVVLDGANGTIKTGPTTLNASGVTSTGFSLTSSGFSLTSGNISLGSQGTGINSGISFSNSGTSISGTIYANAGNIGGCTISNGLLQVPAARITGKLTANQVDANIVTVGSDGWVHASKANITTCSVVSLQNSAGGQTITFNHDDFVALYNLIHQ